MLFAALLWVAACSSDPGDKMVKDGSVNDGGAIDCSDLNSPPPTCGDTCQTDLNCGAGTFCKSNECVAACTDNDPCPEGRRCTSRGRCEDFVSDAGTDAGDGAACIDDEVTPTRIIPNAMFLVDKSGSMDDDLDGNNNPDPGESRWEIARAAILAVAGELEDIVQFGARSYHNTLPANDPGCPELAINVDFAFGNASMIAANYPADPSVAQADTPTGESLDALVTFFGANPPPDTGPTIIVLATDGEPDTCAVPNPQNGQPEAIAGAQNAFSAGIQTFMLSVGSDVGASHMQDMACAGIGIDPASPSCTFGSAPFWVGTSPEQLEDHFRTIISDQISCEVQLNGVIEDFDRVCEGDVELNNVDIACVHGASCTPGPGSNCDGWRIKDGTDDTLELLGQACQDWKEGAEPLTAVFPCGIIVVE